MKNQYRLERKCNTVKSVGKGHRQPCWQGVSESEAADVGVNWWVFLERNPTISNPTIRQVHTFWPNDPTLETHPKMRTESSAPKLLISGLFSMKTRGNQTEEPSKGMFKCDTSTRGLFFFTILIFIWRIFVKWEKCLGYNFKYNRIPDYVWWDFKSEQMHETMWKCWAVRERLMPMGAGPRNSAGGGHIFSFSFLFLSTFKFFKNSICFWDDRNRNMLLGDEQDSAR